jgi:hypothetical protein
MSSFSISTVMARSVNFNEPIYRNGWNIISGTGYNEGETVTARCDRGQSQYIDLGTTRANESGAWFMYFMIDDIDYWPIGIGEERIRINVFSSEGPLFRYNLVVVNGSDPNIYPPRDYFETPIKSETWRIKGVLWKIYVNPNISSIIYREVSIDRIVNYRHMIKNYHLTLRDK